MKDGLMKLYHQYDIDGDGHIDERELWAMLTEVIIASGIGKEGFTEEDAKTVMAALDEDGNGTVEKAELVEWVLSGLKRPIADRRAFAKTSPFASRLDQFLTACGLLASRFAKLPVSKKSPKKNQKPFPITIKGKVQEKMTILHPSQYLLLLIEQVRPSVVLVIYCSCNVVYVFYSYISMLLQQELLIVMVLQIYLMSCQLNLNVLKNHVHRKKSTRSQPLYQTYAIETTPHVFLML